MTINILKECGYDEAMLGLALNKNQSIDNMQNVALKLANLDNGHNKFLEQIQGWLLINAPRYWWQEFDTYRVGISKQSQSTIHTLIKTINNKEDLSLLFENQVLLPEVENKLKEYALNNDLIALKQILPESFLQTRLININYKSLRNIIKQRTNHKLPHWNIFIDHLINNLEHPEFIKCTL